MSSGTSDSEDFEIIEHQRSPVTRDELGDIEAWLEPTNYLDSSSEFNRHLTSRALGTGFWVCDTPQYRQWHDSDVDGGVWLIGAPGTGKSVVSASMVQHLETTENVPVLSFFFRYIIESNRKSRNLICDWLAQLLPYNADLQIALNSVVDSKLEHFSNGQLWEYLLIGLRSAEKVYCVVDAMDEMEIEEGDDFLHRLNSLATFRPQSVKLLMTSRPNQLLQRELKDSSIIHISHGDNLVLKDIAVFVSHRLEVALKGQNSNLQKSLQLIVCQRSAGLFLFARLLLDQLMPVLMSKQHANVEEIANNLPIGMHDMYNRILLQQSITSGIGTEVQAFIFKAVVFSSRLLRLNELADLVAFVYPGHQLSAAKSIVKSACTPLLEFMEDETAQIIHHSIAEFLIDASRTQPDSSGASPQFPVLDHDSSHKDLMILCLAYMQSDALLDADSLPHGAPLVTLPRCDRDDDKCKCGRCEPDLDNKMDYQKAKLEHPFLDYAVRNWTYHGNKYDVEDKQVFDAITSFLNPERLQFRRWLTLEWGIRFIGNDIVAPSPIHVAAFAGMNRYLKDILCQSQDGVNSKDSRGCTPLHLACQRGHTKMVELLLQSGATLDDEDDSRLRPIHEAVRRSFASIVQALLRAGVDPTRSTDDSSRSGLSLSDRDKEGEPGTALYYMSLNGHVDTIVVTLPFLDSRGVEELLWRCCRSGKSDPVRAILGKVEVSANFVYNGLTLLYAACMGGSSSCVEQILARGADPNAFSQPKLLDRRQNLLKAVDRKYFQNTALHVLAERWGDDNRVQANEQILNLLVKYGANLEAKDSNGYTPLWLCFTPRTRNVTKSGIGCFLKAGSSASITDEKGYGAIYHILVRIRDIELLKLLIHHGADVSALSIDGSSCLEAMFVSNFMMKNSDSFDDTIQFLVKNGARCDVQPLKGLSVMERVAHTKDCNIKTFKVILQYCSDKNIKRRCLFSLKKDTKGEMVEFIQELISSGLSLEERDQKGCTALIANIQNPLLFQALWDCGAQIDAVDNQGKGVWHHALSRYPSDESLNIIRSLIVKDGQDPRQVDNVGDTVFHEVAKLYYGMPEEVTFMKELFAYGLSMNAKNKAGKTPLHVYVEDQDPRRIYHGRGTRPGDIPCTVVPFIELAMSCTEGLEINSQDNEGLSALHAAALHSEVHVSNLLDAGANSTILTNEGRNVLHLACRARRSDVVHLVIEKADRSLINQVDASRRTPLHDACASGRPESVYLLLKAGADIAAKDSRGHTPLHACTEFIAEQNLWFLQKHPLTTPVGQINSDRYRPGAGRFANWSEKRPGYHGEYGLSPEFHENDTARVGSIAEALINAGADPLALDSSNNAPLDLAILYGCSEMVQALSFTVLELNNRHKFKPENKRLHVEIDASHGQAMNFSIRSPVEDSEAEVMKHPGNYIHLLGPNDVTRIYEHGGDITGAGDCFKDRPLLHLAAERGLTEMVSRLANIVTFFDDEQNIKSIIKKSMPPYPPYSENHAPILHQACGRSMPNFQMLELLVEKCNINVNAYSFECGNDYSHEYSQDFDFLRKRTALHVLANANHFWQLEAIRYLVKHGANIECRDDSGATPLLIASEGILEGHHLCHDERGSWRLVCVEVLLELGADPNALDNRGYSCLNRAAKCPEMLRLLLKRGLNTSLGKPSPLFTAIQEQYLESMEILLGHGVSANAVDESMTCQVHHNVKHQKRTALFCASFPSSLNRSSKAIPNLVKCLLEHGSDMYATLDHSETLLHYVFRYGGYETVCAFLDYDKVTEVKLEAKDPIGRSILIAACDWKGVAPGYRHKHWFPKEPSIVGRIIELGADISTTDNEERSALHHLLDNFNMEEDTIFEFLKQPAAKDLVCRQDTNGFFPIHCALRLLRPAICEKLTSLGANLLEPDPEGMTALHHISAQYQQVEEPRCNNVHKRDHTPEYYPACERLWQKCLDVGIDINTRDNNGFPPLFFFLAGPAGRSNLIDGSSSFDPAFNVLFGDDKDLDLQAVNNDGENALHIIAKREKQHYKERDDHAVKLFEFMVGKGLDPLQEDGKGRSALDVADACGKKDILEMYKEMDRKSNGMLRDILGLGKKRGLPPVRKGADKDSPFAKLF